MAIADVPIAAGGTAVQPSRSFMPILLKAITNTALSVYLLSTSAGFSPSKTLWRKANGLLHFS